MSVASQNVVSSKFRWSYVVELALLVFLGLNATRLYADFDPHLHLSGFEAQNVTASAHFLHGSIQKLGYIPYWQPYSNKGQPFIDEAYEFVINPFNFVPILLYGDNNGLKVSVILHFILAGFGGWFLARMLGMGMLARMMLGGLLIVKGNMLGTMGAGFFQLAIAQAYSPWVLAGALAIVRQPEKRWGAVLLAVALALVFYCGTIFYFLPSVIIAVFVYLFYAVRIEGMPPQILLDERITRRFLLAGGFTLGLIAVTALTIVLNFSLLGNHPSQTVVVGIDASTALVQFVNPILLYEGLFSEFNYSYIIPFWFLVLLFVFIPPMKSLHRPADQRHDRHLWLIGGIGFLFFFAWGVSLQPVVPWIYANVPVIGQWRFPERMLAVASVFLIFLIAYRLDGLQRALLNNFSYSGTRGSVVRMVVSLAVVLASGFALVEVYQNTRQWRELTREDSYVDACVKWLLNYAPNEFVSVGQRDFQTVATYIRNGVRLAHIGADYFIEGVPSTLYPFDLTRLPPPYYIPAWDQTPDRMREQGFVPVDGSPPISPQFLTSCLWRNPTAPAYAFSVPLNLLETTLNPLDGLSPVTYLGRTPEHIWLEAQPLSEGERVVVAQDVAYPGWTVLVNGAPARLESVGGLLGVVLPPGEQSVLVEFIYTAPTLKIGGMITLITAAAAILYLLRAERLRRLRPFRARTRSTVPQPVPILVPERMPSEMPMSLQPSENSNMLPVVQPIRVESSIEGNVIRVVVPPSSVPSLVEVVIPNRRTGIAVTVLAGLGMVLLYLLAWQRRPKR